MGEKITVNVSGGCDSTAVCLLYKERGIDFEMLFADTGAELPENYWFLPRLAKYVGKPLHVVSNGGFFLWLNKYEYLLPSLKIRWCTKVLKAIPMAKFHGNEPYIHAVGIRADEIKRIRPQEKWDKNEQRLYPLVEAGMDKKEVKKLCEKHGMLNPVYDWRSNVSCFCCPLQRLQDWKGLYVHHPNLFMIAEKWEGVRKRNSEHYSWRGDKWTLEKIRKNVESCGGSLFNTKEVENE